MTDRADANPAGSDPAATAADAWPARRAGLWLTAAGTGLMLIGTLASTGSTMLITGPSRSVTAPVAPQINEVALWMATLMTHASQIGGVMMGLGITLFIAWEPILTGVSNRMHRLQTGHRDRPGLGADRTTDPAGWSDEVLEPDTYE